MGTFEIIKSKKGYHFNLKAANHRVVLTSENYKSLSGSEIGVASVMANAKNRSSFRENVSIDDKDYFTLCASNGEVIGMSQMYKSENGMYNGIQSVMNNAPKAKIVYIGCDPTPINNFIPLDDKSNIDMCGDGNDIHHIDPLEMPSLNHNTPQLKNEAYPVIEHPNTKNESIEVEVSPKLKKNNNVITRTVQRISRLFVGNV